MRGFGPFRALANDASIRTLHWDRGHLVRASVQFGMAAGGTPAVPVKPKYFGLRPQLCDQLIAEARAAYPNECCGLIEGVRHDSVIEALKLHPARNLASRADRFEIDPMEQFRLLHSLRDTDRDIVGCYHSHPDGEAVPSEHDLAMAGEEDFVWLIAAIRQSEAGEIAAYVFATGRFQRLALV